MIILRHAKYISGGKIYSSGEIVPDTAVTRGLVEKGFAEILNAKPAKKPKAEAPRENDTGNS